MRTGIILAISALLFRASAFDVPGSYERVWYYYAYLADVQLGQGVAPKIAAGCPKVMSTGGKPCSFNQFMAYIEGKTEPYSLTTEQMPDVDTAAKLLQSNEITGQYKPRYVYQTGLTDLDPVEEKAGAAARLFINVGKYLSSTVIFAVDDTTIKTSIQQAISAVVRERAVPSIQAVKAAFAEAGLVIKLKNVPLFEGSSEEVEALASHATEEA